MLRDRKLDLEYDYSYGDYATDVTSDLSWISIIENVFLSSGESPQLKQTQKYLRQTINDYLLAKLFAL